MIIPIVVVDDEQNALNALNRCLKFEGIEAHFFNNPFEALTYIKNNAVDILISDLKMPIMDGVDLLKIVMSCSPETFRIILSGADYSEIKTKRALEDRTIEQWFEKTGDFSKLVEYLKHFYRNQIDTATSPLH